MTVEVYVALGSNVERERNLRWALAQLRARFGVLRASPVFRNAPVGFTGDDFYNLVVGFDTAEPARAVSDALEEIEDRCGRNRNAERFGPRALDLDLLLYGDCVLAEPGLVVPRPDLLRYAFMLGPLAAIAGDRRHPVNGRSFAQLWGAFDQAAHPLREVPVPGLGANA